MIFTHKNWAQRTDIGATWCTQTQYTRKCTCYQNPCHGIACTLMPSAASCCAWADTPFDPCVWVGTCGIHPLPQLIWDAYYTTSSATSWSVQLDMVNDLHLWLMAWWLDLQLLQTKVWYLIQTVENPNFFCVPQLAQMLLEGFRASSFTSFSAAADDILLCVYCSFVRASCEYGYRIGLIDRFSVHWLLCGRNFRIWL